MKQLLLSLGIFPCLALAFNCHKAATTYDMRRCNDKQFSQQDKKLNENYQKLMTYLNSKQKAVLKKAQRAWLSFRGAQCHLLYLAYEGGTFAPVAQGYCMTDLTQQQVKNLKTAIEEYQPH